MLQKYLLIVIIMLVSSGLRAQKRDRYEFCRNTPAYADQIIADLKYPLAWQNAGIRSFAKWKKEARKKVLECMMTPPPAASSWDMRIISEEQRDGYRAQKIEFNLSRYYRVSALLLIPDGKGPFPAVNALHDHGAHLYIGKEKMIRPFADDLAVLEDSKKWVESLYEGQYLGDYLAKNGYVVFSCDAPMWGERGRMEGADRKSYDVIAGNMMMYGIDLCAYMTYDDIASTEFLSTLGCVDKKRIGCAGCSMGAYRTWMLSALSDRIKAGAAICWMTTTASQMTLKSGRSENGGFANCIPGLRQWMDYPHIASLACPKPMLFISGKKDKLFQVDGVNDAFSSMREVWTSQNASGYLVTEIWDMPHSCPKDAQKAILDFFKKNL